MMLRSIIHTINNSREEEKQQEIANVRAEIKKIYKDFLDGEGRLPEGFSERYNKILPDGYIIRKTPFELYLKNIWKSVDKLRDESGISDWLYLDESVDINTAAAGICDWIKRHKEMNDLLSKKCQIGNTTIMLPLSTYCDGKLMVVIDDSRRFDDITKEYLHNCKAVGISFCTIISDCALYDLIEQKEKKITYVTYPNYHDETYADWSLE